MVVGVVVAAAAAVLLVAAVVVIGVVVVAAVAAARVSVNAVAVADGAGGFADFPHVSGTSEPVGIIVARTLLSVWVGFFLGSGLVSGTSVRGGGYRVGRPRRHVEIARDTAGARETVCIAIGEKGAGVWEFW